MDAVAYFSSHGPSPDGRIKPDILAPGFSIYSVAAKSENSGPSNSDCALEWKAGTSMSTPVAAANALLIRYHDTSMLKFNISTNISTSLAYYKAILYGQ